MTPDVANALPRRPSPGAAGARLAQLYAEHARMVYGVCRLVLHDADEAEDAAQQVFLSAYRALLAGTEPRNAGAWLGTIARNEARGRLATRSRRPLLLDDRDEAASSSLEEQADARADLAALRTQIAALPGKQREAVVLRDIYGLRYDEVARALNTSRPAVEALLFRGRRRLQRRLRPGLAAGVLVVPLALRESLAYAVPGFAGGGASTVGLLGKLAAVPVAAKLAAAGVTVGAVGSVGLVGDSDLRRSRPPAPPVVTVVAEDKAPQPRPAAGPPASPAPVRAVSAVPGSRKVDTDGDDARADELEDETVEDDREEPEENDRGGDHSGPGRGDEDGGDVAVRHDDDKSVDEHDADDDVHGGDSGHGGEDSGDNGAGPADDED